VEEETMRKLILAAMVTLVLPGLAGAGNDPAAPSGLKAVDGAGTFWPFTGRDFSGTPTDPINLVFLGDADPRLIRQTLLELDGDRTADERLAAFDCTWKDAIGKPQTTYSLAEGWQGSAIELECGEYSTLRAHLRLFRHGPITLGGAHLEVQIPFTTAHEVLSWIIPRELVYFDLYRSGFLVDDGVAPSLTPTPTWRAVNKDVLNGLPYELRFALGLPTDMQEEDWPLPNDGLARVLTLWGQFDPTRTDVVVEFDHLFNQYIPRPVCGEEGDVVLVTGTLHMVHRVQTNPSGKYASRFEAKGVLQVLPVAPAGPPIEATISEVYRSELTDELQKATSQTRQVLSSSPRQWLMEKLWTGALSRYDQTVSCGY
jgi:hypothetical protein